jgi:hypothetical protein
VLVSQTAVGAAQSVDCKHCTHRPASLSHTGAFGLVQELRVQAVWTSEAASSAADVPPLQAGIAMTSAATPFLYARAKNAGLCARVSRIICRSLWG